MFITEVVVGNGVVLECNILKGVSNNMLIGSPKYLKHLSL